MNSILTIEEKSRLDALRRYEILDTAAEPQFDDLAKLAAQVCRTPDARICFIDESRQWFKSCYGSALFESPRQFALCGLTIENADVFIIEDTAKDQRFALNPFVTGKPFIRFYAGVPLISPEGFAIGALSVTDFVPRKLTGEQLESLKILARQIMFLLESRLPKNHLTAPPNLPANRPQNLPDCENLFTNSPVFICTHDKKGVLLSVNPAAANALGYAPEEMTGKSLADFLTTETVKNFDLYLELVNALGKSSGLLNVLTKQGEARTWSFDNAFCRDEKNGQYILGCAQDVTALKRSETNSKTSRKLFEMFMENSPALIYLKDEHGRFLFANGPYKTLLGFSADQLLNKTVFDFADEKLAAEIAELDKIVWQSGQTVESEQIVPGADGTEKNLLNYKFPIEAENGKTYIGGIAIDITERRLVENELAAARDAALESARLKSAFLTNVSHEIRTPMNGVIGMTELLLDTPLDRVQRDYASTIRQSADALLTVINDILDFAKIESGKLRYESVDFDVREIVESTIESLAERAYRKDIEIASLIKSDVPPIVQGDPGRLRQVLTNLLGNAIKFTEQGGVSLDVSVEKQTAENSFLKFTVKDTGIGIAPDALENLFQPFMQADSSTTREFGGTGLGLVISRQIVEMMNGELTVESEPFKGSSFSFTADFADKSDTRARNLPVDSGALPAVRLLASKRILIADSNPVIRRNLSEYGKNWNLDAQTAANGEEILQKLRHAAQLDQPFDFAVIDLNLPDWDGFSLAQKIKTDSLLKQTQIILTTSYGQRGDAAHAQELGVAGYLTKPIRGGQLLECLLAVPANEKTGGEKTPALITKHSLREAKFENSAAGLTLPIEHFRVLVVEDNAINRRVIVEQLKQIGITPDVAADGEDALEKIAAGDYDLALMDCQMPRLDGYQTTRAIRRLEKSRKANGEKFNALIIIALTAHSLAGEREKCLAAGMDDYLAKPVKMKELAVNLQYWKDFLQGGEAEPAQLFPNAAETGKQYNSPPEELSDTSDRLRDSFTDNAFIAEIVNLYLAETSSRLQEITGAAQISDAAAVARLAHAIRGNSLAVGANKIARITAQLEESAQKADFQNTAAQVSQIEDELAVFAAEKHRIES